LGLILESDVRKELILIEHVDRLQAGHVGFARGEDLLAIFHEHQVGAVVHELDGLDGFLRAFGTGGSGDGVGLDANLLQRTDAELSGKNFAAHRRELACELALGVELGVVRDRGECSGRGVGLREQRPRVHCGFRLRNGGRSQGKEQAGA
jgi:hypothetical protein